MIIILGAGLSGLTAAYALTAAGRRTALIEKGTTVGGLARTLICDNHRFDLGGHRFLTSDPKINQLVQGLLGEDLLTVDRWSRIYLRGRYVNYPLNPANAVFGLGLPATLKILSDYGMEKAAGFVKPRVKISLEDWVVAQFGRAMFDLYFRDYSEKVWGIGCNRIDMDWIAQRIDGLSLWGAMKNAFLKVRGKEIKTLNDTFHYPRWGIGQIAERLGKAIAARNRVMTGTEVVGIHHTGEEILAVEVQAGQHRDLLDGHDFISSIPLPQLLKCLSPRPPEEIRHAAAQLAYRDLVTVTLLVDRERVSDLTWLYLPEKKIPFGRIHEPTNWSRSMAPAGRTHLVVEYFCTRGDEVWGASDSQLAALTAEHLQRLGLIRQVEVTGSCVTRIGHAYPLFEIGYRNHVRTIMNYLVRFKNLQVIGRTGMFSYLNMDPAMGSGLEAAERLLGPRFPAESSADSPIIRCPVREAVAP